MKVGVLALQGTFIEHIGILRQLGVEAPPIRLPNELDTLNGLIIPGGESTTMLRLMESFELIQPVKEMARDGLAIWGTCAGMVLLAKSVSNYEMETLRQTWRYHFWAKSHSMLFSFEPRLLKMPSQV